MHQKVDEEEVVQYAKCGICGKDAAVTTTRCRECWQVEHRLETYLSHSAGRVHALELMVKILGR